jgi:hypothetical protein
MTPFFLFILRVPTFGLACWARRGSLLGLGRAWSPLPRLPNGLCDLHCQIKIDGSHESGLEQNRWPQNLNSNLHFFSLRFAFIAQSSRPFAGGRAQPSHMRPFRMASPRRLWRRCQRDVPSPPRRAHGRRSLGTALHLCGAASVTPTVSLMPLGRRRRKRNGQWSQCAASCLNDSTGRRMTTTPLCQAWWQVEYIFRRFML